MLDSAFRLACFSVGVLVPASLTPHRNARTKKLLAKWEFTVAVLLQYHSTKYEHKVSEEICRSHHTTVKRFFIMRYLCIYVFNVLLLVYYFKSIGDGNFGNCYLKSGNSIISSFANIKSLQRLSNLFTWRVSLSLFCISAVSGMM
jgi:hypothetical protein